MTPPPLALDATDHLLPFQDSIRITALPLLVLLNPAALHRTAETHDTLKREPLRRGLGTIDQLVPFQDSIMVLGMPLLPKWTPTAVQAVAETHDTPLRSLWDWRLGLGTTDQLVPFQDSTRVPFPWPLT
jgi:hypothetical protein